MRVWLEQAQCTLINHFYIVDSLTSLRFLLQLCIAKVKCCMKWFVRGYCFQAHPLLLNQPSAIHNILQCSPWELATAFSSSVWVSGRGEGKMVRYMLAWYSLRSLLSLVYRQDAHPLYCSLTINLMNLFKGFSPFLCEGYQATHS